MNEEAIFHAVLAKPAEERAAFLEQACAGDAALRQRLAILLEAHANPGAFLVQPAAQLPSTVDTPAEQVGMLVAGRYKLLEQIGEGGMGTVWVAEQVHPVRRKVAVKLIKAGMDSKTVVSRFEAERQALALMDHPNIAKVLDGGTTGEVVGGGWRVEGDSPTTLHPPPATPSGRPFFVMEYVKGIPLTKYCDDARLSVAERLALFVPVCQAVQHAHQKGIIHRDLKPSNILVCLYDGQPVPKVIDFGLAKAVHQPLTEHTLHTAHGVMMGTPLYMSPEQAELNNLDVDTRTDIYSLGVVLYELLTGTTPVERQRFKQTAWQEMLRLIKEEEPPKPSARLSGSGSLPSLAAQRKLEPVKLTKLVRGELDWIVMKALEKDRSRRYETANGFARDIQAYLADEQVEACPPSRSYRLRKFARKNRAALMMAATILLLLAAGIAVSAWQAIRATEAEAEAKSAEDKAGKDRDKALKAGEEAKEQGLEAIKQAKIATENEGKANKAVQEKDYTLALDRVLLAQAAVNGRNAREFLEQVPADNRKWDWHYVRRQLDGGIFTLYGHTSAVTCVAFSPDGTRLATGSNDKTAKVWDARTGAPLLELKGHGIGIIALAFNSDGTHLVTGSAYGTSKVWNAQTGALLFELNTRGVLSVAFSGDDTRILTGGHYDKTMKIWDARTGAPLAELKRNETDSAIGQFSPEGTRFFARGSDDRTVKVWDAHTGVFLFELKGHTAVVNEGRLHEMKISSAGSVAFSPNRERLATGGSDTTAKVWDARTGALLLDLKGHRDPVLSVAFSPDGTRLVTGSLDGTAKIWGARTGTLLLELKGHSSAVTSAAFSPDGMRVVTGSYDNTARVWDAHTGTPVLEVKDVSPHRTGIFSPDGTRLIGTGSQGTTTRVWDALTATPLLELEGSFVALQDHGTRIVTLISSFDLGSGLQSFDGTKVWDARTGIEVLDPTEATPGTTLTLEGRVLPDGGALGYRNRNGAVIEDAQRFMSMAFSPDGKRRATGNHDGTAQIWDARTGKLLFDFNAHQHWVLSVAFSPDGTRFVTGSKDHTAKVWDTHTGKLLLVLKGHVNAVDSAVFSPDGTRLVSGSNDHTAKVWDARTGTPLLDLRGHTDGVSRVAFSPDGTRIVTVSYDKTAKIWDTRGVVVPVLELKGDTSKIVSASFSLDGTRIVTVHGAFQRGVVVDFKFKSGNVIDPATLIPGGTRRVWDAKTGQELREDPKKLELQPGAISHDGRYLAYVGGFDQPVRIIDLALSSEEREYRRFWTRPRPDLHREEYFKALGGKDTFAARFHRERASGDAQFHVDLGALLRENNDPDGAIAEYRLAIKIDPKLIAAYKKLAIALAEKNDLDGTSAVFRQILALDPKDAEVVHSLGGRPGWQGQPGSQGRPYLAARLLASAFDADPKLAANLKAQHRYNAACYAALAADGQGKDAKELDHKERARWRQQALDWLRADLVACQKEMDGGGADTRALLLWRIAWRWRGDAALNSIRDAAALAKLPAEERQACLNLWADISYFTARLYAAAFTADPKLAGELVAGERYNAARYATLAAAGQGKDTKELDNKERTRWRKQALEWLRADLAAHEKQLASGPQNAQLAVWRLQQWQRDDALIGIREPKALAQLPADERQAYQQLWADVETLAKKAAGTSLPPSTGADKTSVRKTGVPKADTGPWGTFEDPDEDCALKLENGALILTVAGSYHDLCIERGKMNSPRVMRPVDGDFTAVMKVAGKFDPRRPSSILSAPYHGAGFIIRKDDNNYLRLERACLRRGAAHFAYINFERRVAGQPGPIENAGQKTLDNTKDTWLKIVRRGNEFKAYATQEAGKWQALGTATIDAPQRIEVGVAAINSSLEPLMPRYSDFELKKAAPETGR